MIEEQLSDDLYTHIKELCESGDEYQENEQYNEAIEKYQEALRLLPEPKRKWAASTWVLTALGETYFFVGDYEQARKMLQEAECCPDGLGNPFIHLRLGQTQFELGDLTRAADNLVRAYMGGGEEIFDGDDAKYFNFVKQVIKI
jgi:tetratricopeptide (TPR) repeat protein